MQHHNLGSDFYFWLELDLEGVLSSPWYKKYLTIIQLAKKLYDFNILVFLLKNIVSTWKLNLLNTLWTNWQFVPAPHKCRKYNFHGVPLHTKLKGHTRDGRDNIKQF
jgi:hypothetical protein